MTTARHPAATISTITAAVISLAALASLPACTEFNRLTGQGSDSPRAANPLPAPSGLVQQAQLVLQQQGTYSGTVDGIWGPATQEAVRSYQQSHGLGSSGQLDRATLASMNVGARPTAETPRTIMADGSKMSETDARKLFESQGFTNVVGLYRDDNAVWRGVATRNGKSGEVALDSKGNVVTN